MFQLFPVHRVFACGICLLLAVFSAKFLEADILEYTSPSGTVTVTRSSIVNLNVLEPQGIAISSLQHEIRGDSLARDFLLYFRPGTHTELIDVDGTPTPAH